MNPKSLCINLKLEFRRKYASNVIGAGLEFATQVKQTSRMIIRVPLSRTSQSLLRFCHYLNHNLVKAKHVKVTGTTQILLVHYGDSPDSESSEHSLV